MPRTTALFLAGILFSAPAALTAQVEVEAVLTGQLLLDSIPADTGTVVLHRVTPEEAGPVDSVSVGADGRFALTLSGMPVSGSGETLFGASRYEGILYYGRIIEAPADLDSLYTIRTYPTQVAPPEGLAFPVRTREIWIEDSPMGWRVTDRFVLINPNPVTYVADGSGGIVWRYPLPEGARTFRVIEAGPAPGDVRMEEGSIVATNPVSPSGSYYWIQYEIDSLPVAIPMPGPVETTLLIARESVPPIRVEGLAGIAPEEVVGLMTTDRVWFAQAMRDQVIRILPGEEPAPITGWLTVVLATLLFAAGVWVVKRGGSGGRPGLVAPAGQPAVPSSGARRRQEILIEIARLDEEFRGEAGKGEESGVYRRRREALLRELESGSGDAGSRS